MKYHFLILALNEETYLKKTFIELQDVILETAIKDYQISVIDDGSTDSTLEVAKKIKLELDSNFKIITNGKNLGPAISIKNYIDEVQEGKLVIISGDNDLEKDFIKKIINASKKADLVLSCYLNREKKGRLRAFLSTTFNVMMCTIFDVYVFYLQGPAVWPIDIVRKMDIKSKGIAYASEVHIKLLYSGLSFIEVAGYCNVGSEKSTSVKLSSFIDIYKCIFRLIYEIKIKKKFKTKSIRIK
jgi:glycosyltransferase involved in cell wall biosynthesis